MNDSAVASETVGTSHFQHRLFRKIPASQDSGALHIYIEGDGRPWRRRNLVAADPTSPEPLMLEAMLRDDADSIYLGRPCYYELAGPGCGANWWTHDRHHPLVVESMRQVIENLGEGREELWLIGHSGGGSLAVLIGRRLSRPVKVVTVSANLDTRVWSEHHGYSPLTGSLNPMEDSAQNPQMAELHWYGEVDQTILPAWTLAYCQRFASTCLAAPAEHRDGWLAQWETVLSRSRDLFAQ